MVPQRLSFGRDGGGGGIQPGAGRFSLPAVEGNGSREGAEVVPSKKGGVVASLHPKVNLKRVLKPVPVVLKAVHT